MQTTQETSSSTEETSTSTATFQDYLFNTQTSPERQNVFECPI